ncbi:MAG: metallophosphoesterase [Vicinamibacterales bacterium]
MRRFVLLALLTILPCTVAGQELKLPNKEGSVKFAIIGDSGQPGSGQVAVANQMASWRMRYPFEFVLMMGDNLYGGERPKDYEKKFAAPYKALIDGGVKFYASLGNHDDAGQTNYKLFNMNGQKYYSFKPKDGVRFFAIDSNYVDPKQAEWLDKELAASGSEWKIAFFHHPLYSSGATHGSADLQRGLLEPVFLKYGVNVVFAGHEHFYERLKPQKGVAYFILGSSAKLRTGDLRKSELTAYGNDRDYAFILVEIAGDELFFQTINQKGATLDAGSIRRVGEITPTPTVTAQPVVPQAPAPAQPQPPSPK